MTHDNDNLPPRYRDPELIGQGGMGEIYRALDQTLGRTVAIKMLADRYASEEGVRGRFTREALAAARLSGEPNTVTIFDVGEHSQRPFIVMEYAEGGSLEDVLRKEGAQAPGRVLDWLGQAGAALDAAHRHGVVHRDVKPGNILLARDGTVRVADFGVASAAGLDSLTATGTVLGTAGYLAPEQARGEPTTPATDRYALGVLAFELLTGRRPFESDSPTAEAAAHVHAPVPSVCERADVPCELDPVFERALAKDPAERFPTSAEFVAALGHALHSAERSTRELAPLAPVPAGPARPAPAATGRNFGGWPVLVGGVLAAAALAGAGVAAILDRGGDESAGTPSVVTRVRTLPGTTVRETVPTTVQASTREQPPPPPVPSSGGGRQLTDQATALLQRGDWAGAEGVARQAVTKLEGTSDRTYLAYALYDLGRALAEQGSCGEALQHLKRSEQLQGHRSQIDQARAKCRAQGD
jgi:eukaryotic-like serine/threonine-protein kinase